CNKVPTKRDGRGKAARELRQGWRWSMEVKTHLFSPPLQILYSIIIVMATKFGMKEGLTNRGREPGFRMGLGYKAGGNRFLRVGLGFAFLLPSAAPTALPSSGYRFPALAGWASLSRAYGAFLSTRKLASGRVAQSSPLSCIIDESTSSLLTADHKNAEGAPSSFFEGGSWVCLSL